MDTVKHIDTVQDYNEYFGITTLHPLVTVMEGASAKPLHYCKKLYGTYVVLMKGKDCGKMNYGRSLYDYSEGSVLFISPGQVAGSDDDGFLHQPEGWALAFHPEFLRGTPLTKLMKDYSFFSYNSNEALHVSDTERDTIIMCMKLIRDELAHPVDRHSKALIADKIKMLLDYCIRFYDRQFITRENANNDIIARLESVIDEYLANSEKIATGMPTVQYCADALCVSANYLSDLMRKTTGQSALKYIQQQILNEAKNRLFDPLKTISEISYSLGFPYPQHFTRWFKNLEGCTPQQYRNAN